MTSNRSQARWRAKNKQVKRQLNVMARKYVHEALEDMVGAYGLRGKAEAVTFCTFVAMALQQHREINPEAEKLMALYFDAYLRDRDILSP